MLEIFGKQYYIDLDAVTDKCRTKGSPVDENGDATEINVFKYDIIKMCIDRLVSFVDEEDDDIGVFGKNETPISFKIAFNTLLRNEIIIEDE